ncbi:FISUMP domain-containing protein [Bacteroidota bacterium]
MKTKSFTFLTGLALLCFLLIQNGINAQNVTVTDDESYTAESSAMLDVKSTNKGMLVPRMDSSQRVNISSPASGLLVYDTDATAFYFFNGTSWVNLTTNVISPASANVDDALFSVVNANGDTVFAVYPEGVKINVGDGNGKANKGGFAIGGLASGKLPQQQFLVVSPDSVRVYVDTTTRTKATKGGFAIGGLASGKATGPELMRVTSDSVRIYIDESTEKGTKGGFAIGGLASGKSNTDSLYMFSDRSGFNVSYLTSTERDAIAAPRIGSMIFNTTDSCLQIFLGYWESIWCTPLGCIYPSILTQPVNDSVWTGEDAIFTVSATGSKIYYKWQESSDGGNTWRILSDGGTNPEYSGTYTDTLLINNAPDEISTYQYRCLINNACGDELTQAAVLQVGCGSPLYDIAGNSYTTVSMGTQCWMKENLRTTKYPDNAAITKGPTTHGAAGWSTDNAYYSCPSNSTNNGEDCAAAGSLGMYYQWSAVCYGSEVEGVQGICPAGWHVPTDAEWKTLEGYLGMSVAQQEAWGLRGTNEGSKLASNITDQSWAAGSLSSDADFDESGFDAGPAGSRWNNGYYADRGTYAWFWSSTLSSPTPNVLFHGISNASTQVSRGESGKMQANSVRCLKND